MSDYPSYGLVYYSSTEFDRLIRPGFGMNFSSMSSLGDTNGSYSMDPLYIQDLYGSFPDLVEAEIVGGKFGIDGSSMAVTASSGYITSGGHIATATIIPNSSTWNTKILFGNVYASVSSTQLEIGLFDGTNFVAYQATEISARNSGSLILRWDGKDRFRAFWNTTSIYSNFDGIDIFGEIPVIYTTGNVVSSFSSTVAAGFTIDSPIASQRGCQYGKIVIDGDNIKWPIDDATPTEDSDGGTSLSAALDDLAADGISPFIHIDHAPYSLQDGDPVGGGIPALGNESDYAATVAAIVDAGYSSSNIILMSGTKFATYEALSACFSATYYAIKEQLPSSNIYGPNLHLKALNDSHDEDFGGFTVDSRLMDGLDLFLNDPDIEFDGLAVSAEFGSPSEWTSFIQYLKDLTDKKIIITNIFDSDISSNFLYQESGMTNNVIIPGTLNVNFGYNINPTGNNQLEVVFYNQTTGGSDNYLNQTFTWSFDSDPSSSVNYVGAGSGQTNQYALISHEFPSYGTFNAKLEVYDSSTNQTGEFFTTINTELSVNDVAFISNGIDIGSVLTGSSAPTSVIGDYGDLYIQSSPLRIYGPKTKSFAPWADPWGNGDDLNNYPGGLTVSIEEPVDQSSLWVQGSSNLFSLTNFRNLSDGGIPALTNGHGSNDPANILDLATLYNPNPDPGNCQDPNTYTYPSPPNGAMQYLNYNISTSDINKVSAEFMIVSDMSDVEATYFQFYEADIDSSHQYFGVQTDATFGGGSSSEQLLIFSKFLNRAGDASEYRVFGDTNGMVGTDEGDYISVRLPTTLTAGQWYTIDVRRAEYEALTINSVSLDGDWFDYYFDGTRIAGIWFERDSSSVEASFAGDGSSWTEYWLNNNNLTLYTVPEQEFRLRPLEFNNALPYSDSTITSAYTPMPNSDTYYQQGDNVYEGYIVLKFGGDTPRCHDAGVLDLSVVTNVQLSTFHNCEIVNGTLYGSVVDGKYNSGMVTDIPASGDFRINVRLGPLDNQSSSFANFGTSRLNIIATSGSEAIGLGLVINDATTTVLGLGKVGEPIPIDYFTIDRMLEEDEIIALGYDSATSEWKVYLNDEEVLSGVEATIDRNNLTTMSIVLDGQGDAYNASIKYIAVNDSNTSYFDGTTKVYAHNGSTWISLPEASQRGHSEFYSPLPGLSSYAWEFRAYLNSLKDLTNVNLKIISYSTDIMYNAIVYISSNGATPYEQTFEITGPNQILYLGDLDADEYTIDFYGDCKKSGVGNFKMSVGARNMNTVYISDSMYIKDNTNISVSF